jgi:hypothetical protein
MPCNALVTGVRGSRPPPWSRSLTFPKFLCTNLQMGRPRTRNVAMINGRITPEQMEWLQAKASELGENLSAALRQAITDARTLELAREDYKLLRAEHPEFEIPPHDDVPETRLLAIVLSMKMSEADDLELRREELGEGK